MARVIEAGRGKSMAEPSISTASLRENLRFNLGYVLPNLLQGAFRRRPFWVGLMARLQGGPLSAGLGSRLREKYGTKGIYVRFLTQRALLLLDPEETRRVLDRSPFVFADPPGKRRGMSHFQPQAVTISRGELYRRRRSFNEAVLRPREMHPLAEAFHVIVRTEAARAFQAAELRWGDFADLFERISLRVLFGSDGEPQRRAARLLARLMDQANRGFLLRRGRLFRDYRAALIEAMGQAPPESLAGHCRAASPDDDIAAPDQLTHWLFAMRDTLTENLVRAVGVVDSLPAISRRVREELQGKDLDQAIVVDRLPYLEGCLQEAMRLWPTTPFLLREAVEEQVVCGTKLPCGTQIVVANLFDHLDGTVVPDAARFDPLRWRRGPQPFHHFGGGTQYCPGAALALFLAKGTLATLLEGAHFEVLEPRVDDAGRLPRSYNPFAIRMRRANAVA